MPDLLQPRAPALHELQVLLPGGQQGWVVAYEADWVTLDTASASPPGSSLQARTSDALHELTLKVRGCRKQVGGEAERAFRIEGRLVSPTRALRALLATALGH